jgi:hypothetical protein
MVAVPAPTRFPVAVTITVATTADEATVVALDDPVAA